ncbi:MAG: adenylosuccinate lyase [Methylacidiphilales bacterium]|nr:adenylosuccinate lyase [Candidatus Methylacidiphilales bacterium]
MNPLLAISPIDGRYHDSIPDSMRLLFSEYGLIKKRLFVEIEWLIFQSPEISEKDKIFLRAIVINYDTQSANKIKEIEKITAHDVKATELFIAQSLPAHLASIAPKIHIGLTSEDINNIAYSLILQESSLIIQSQVKTLIGVFVALAHEQHDTYMIARTHGQAATPTSFGKEMAVYADRLTRVSNQFSTCSYYGKITGASGSYATFALFEKDAEKTIRSHNTFISNLGLLPIQYTTQIASHDDIAIALSHLSSIGTIIKDACVDLWLYCSYGYLLLKNNKNEVGSSTMPHKINPIHFENAEGNVELGICMAQYLSRSLPCSRLQRDLSGSTKMRNLGVAVSHIYLGISNLLSGLSRVSVHKELMAKELDNHWEVIAEAIQTAMRKIGIENAYDIIKKESRGKQLTKDDVQDMLIKYNLQNILKDISPSTFTGYASYLALKIGLDEPKETK